MGEGGLRNFIECKRKVVRLKAEHAGERPKKKKKEVEVRRPHRCDNRGKVEKKNTGAHPLVVAKSFRGEKTCSLQCLARKVGGGQKVVTLSEKGGGE